MNFGGQSSAGPTEGVIVLFFLPWLSGSLARGSGVLVSADTGGIGLYQPVDVPSRVRPGP